MGLGRLGSAPRHIQAALNKKGSGNRKTPEQIDAAVRQLVSKAITTDGRVIDVFTAAGLSANGAAHFSPGHRPG